MSFLVDEAVEIFSILLSLRACFWYLDDPEAPVKLDDNDEDGADLFEAFFELLVAIENYGPDDL